MPKSRPSSATSCGAGCELLGRSGRSGGRPDRVRVGAGQPRHQPGVRAESDDLAGRKRPVELGHGEVLVHDAAALERDVADDAPLLHADDDDERAHAVGELAGEAAQHLGLAVGELVVGGRPALARSEHDAPLRAAGEPGHELADRAHDGVDVVGLHVDRAEGRLLLPPDMGLERGDRRLEHSRGLGEPGADPRVSVLVRGLDLDPVGAGFLRLLDQAKQDLFARSTLDVGFVSHYPGTLSPRRR